MHSPSNTISLTRRVIDNFLLYSLGCLFLSIALVLTFHWQGLLMSQLHLVVIIPAVCLSLGVLMFRSMFKVTGNIDGQIRNFAMCPETEQLNPIYRPDPLAAGWNMLLDKIGHSASSETLETRICQSLGNLKSHKHQLVFETFPDGLVITDSEGNITHSNRAFPIVLHLDQQTDHAGSSALALLNIDKLENKSEILPKMKHQIASVVFEMTPDGLKEQGTIIRVSRNKLVDADGNNEGFVWSFRDITQAKLAEEMRNQFVFTATHELRTPLTNIKAYAETLALDEQIEVEDQKKFCNIINAEVTRLSRFVDELLNVSQMEAGALSLNLQNAHLDRLFEEVIEYNKPQIEKKQMKFTSVLPPKLPEALVDKDKISASLVNLLGNAIKYTPEGGEVSFRVLQNENSVTVEIEDTGYGISEDELAKIYDKFFRSDDKRVRDISGSGLGLAFAKEAIRLHGGTLDVTSQIDQGTKFVMTLPITK